MRVCQFLGRPANSALLPDVWTEVRSVLSALLAGRPKNWHTLKSVVLQLLCYLFANQNGRP
ncbi:MAG: hypothetical protein QNJ22_24305 [Desulfosarcinaceae bacterium]|nr:hypothetical protein [Desulfosarcinaceae bacterium]